MAMGALVSYCSVALTPPASSFFLRQVRPVQLQSSLFLSSRLRLRPSRHFHSNPRPRVLVQAEAESEESPPPDNEELNEEEDDLEETVQMTPPFEDSSDDENEEEVRPTGPVSWLKENIRRKSKEKLEAKQAEKSAEALEIIRQSELRRIKEEEELEEQAEREMIQNTMWAKSIQKFQGKLKGLPSDPLPGEEIPYSVSCSF